MPRRHQGRAAGPPRCCEFPHQPGLVDIAPGVKFFVLYPLIPWIGVMAAGYALGPVFTQERAARVQQLFMLGAAVTLGFFVLRATNLYGDPAPWAIQDNLLATVLSFINREKYPPSLLYLAMTLGPALMLLAAFEWARGQVADWIATFGRVPFFYYVAHIFFCTRHDPFAWATIGDIGWVFGPLARHKPAAYGSRSRASMRSVAVVVVLICSPVAG
jgi:uncharacterized membrane protein